MARVLIADDATIVRKLMREMLERAEHEVVGEATNGEEALRLHAEQKPDVSVLDVNMPAPNGFAVAESIRRVNPYARLIVVSVYMSEARQLLAKGLDVAFLTKPFEADELLTEVDREAARLGIHA